MRKKKTDTVYIIAFITAIVLLLLCSCTKHRICSCDNTNIGHRVQIDLSQCREYTSCEQLNEIINYDECRDL